jgi:hypothetical protein
MTDAPPADKWISVDLSTAVAVGMAAICCLLFHGYAIFNFNLSIDEELSAVYFRPLISIDQGRWGEAFLQWALLPYTTIPITPVAVGLTAYSAAFVLLIRRLHLRRWEAVVAASPLFFGFPILLYVIAFSSNIFEFGIGALAAVLVTYYTDKNKLLHIVLAMILVASTLSIYQSLIFLVIIVFLADLVRVIWLTGARLRDKHLLTRIIRFVLIVIGGVVVYVVIEVALLWWFGRHIAYLDHFFHPEIFFAEPLAVIKATLVLALQFEAGSAPPFLDQAAYYRLLIGTCVALLFWELWVLQRSDPGRAALILALLISILLMPFAQHPFNGADLPYRVMVSLPAAVSILALFAVEMAPAPFRRWVVLPLAALLIVEFSAINNRQYYAGHWALERDIVLGAQITQELQRMSPDKSKYTIAIVGNRPLNVDIFVPLVPSSTIGASFFFWDFGSTERIAIFLGFLSQAKFSFATPEQMERAFDAAAAMPSWPAPGSIAQIDDVFVIKLSEPASTQLQNLCQGRTSDFCTKHP